MPGVDGSPGSPSTAGRRSSRASSSCFLRSSSRRSSRSCHARAATTSSRAASSIRSSAGWRAGRSSSPRWLIIAFEMPLVLRNLQITARIIGIGAGGSFFKDANTWFTDSTVRITGTPGFIGSLVVLAIIAGVVLLPTRTFHRVVTALAIFGVAGFVAHVRVRPPRHEPERLRAQPAAVHRRRDGRQIAAPRPTRRSCPGTTDSFLSDLFSHTVFPIMLSIALPVHRVPVLGVHRGRGARQRPARRPDRAARRLLASASSRTRSTSTTIRAPWLRHERQLGAHRTGAFNENLPALPMGQPNAMPLLGMVANSSLWPIWALISFAGSDLPVPALPRLHQLHQPHAARMEPRPAAARSGSAR